MLTKIIDLLFGSIINGVTKYIKDEQQRRSYEAGIVAKAEKERLQNELEEIITTAQLRRRAALDPLLRDRVREHLYKRAQ